MNIWVDKRMKSFQYKLQSLIRSGPNSALLSEGWFWVLEIMPEFDSFWIEAKRDKTIISKR